jgi:tripartite-type tricarboxylate transporter receptor subunit TctC
MSLLCRAAVAALTAIAFVWSGVASAQNYPTKPIRFVLGVSPDLLPRLIGQKLTASWGQQVVVDQRPGAGGVIAAEMVSKAPPDGYTLLLTTGAYTIHAVTAGPKLPYNLERDLMPVTLLTVLPAIVVVNPSVPATTLEELLRLARAKPGQLNCAHAGPMTSSQFGCELLKAAAKINMVSVPYKTSAAALLSVVGGESQVEVSVMQGSLPYIRSEKLRPLAITGAKRSVQLPDIPTVIEAGYPAADYFSWNGVHVTAGTPQAIVAKLNAELIRILRMPDVKERMLSLGLEPEGNTQEEFAAFVKADIARWREAVKIIGVQTE